ncbi:glycosyltransferase [Agromyces sp. LHK192]|uniref:glycosyltransferase n=1 Tax=Agromyces sp. LHK192 TaxID=2498704 RepID=UPI000FD7D2DE|nr:glycosyltransferase [Agromyces sp. LHK192]
MEAALDQRLLALAPYMAPGVDGPGVRAERGSGALLDEIVREVRATAGSRSVWLLIVALTATFPNASRVQMVRRAIDLAEPALASAALLECCYDDAARFAMLDVEIDVIADGVVVDVDFCANHLHNTGIQRVVRQTMSRWVESYDVRLVAWTAGGGAMRTMSALERHRVTAWNTYVEPERSEHPVDPPRFRVVVPVDSAVILPEVPQNALVDPLAALAEHSGNRVGLVGYDAIPVVSADMLPALETERYVRYLTVVKHAARVAGISDAATAEFAGFGRTLSTQGLSAPETVSIVLPVDAPDHPIVAADATAEALVLCVGSQEPRKNQLSVLHAAEVLWREGLQFSLTFIGGGSLWFTRDFDRRIARLRRAGRRIEVLRGVNDAVLLDAYSRARLSVFPSLHEGYGLPVAESLSYQTPVITSSYGSTAEIAVGGGCVLVDPRDDDELVAAMRSLLTDDARLAQLKEEIAIRADDTWDDYASKLWDGLVVPLSGVPRGD